MASVSHRRSTQALELAPHAQRAHPNTERFLPLLVAFGATRAAQH
jgi:4,5-DOPA dioxygenase extradiol